MAVLVKLSETLPVFFWLAQLVRTPSHRPQKWEAGEEGVTPDGVVVDFRVCGLKNGTV